SKCQIVCHRLTRTTSNVKQDFKKKVSLMNALASVLAYLDTAKITSSTVFEDWQIVPIGGGANNLLYRVSGASGDYAVKFTVQDTRRRAEREFYALSVLQHLNNDLAPCPVLLDGTSYSQPVVAQTWIEGEVRDESPQTDADWHMLLNYLAALHS